MTETPDRVSVPVEPTKAMLEAACMAYGRMVDLDETNGDRMERAWSAMLSAAPRPTGEGGDLVLAPRWVFRDFLDNAPGWPDTARRYLAAPPVKTGEG